MKKWKWILIILLGIFVTGGTPYTYAQIGAACTTPEECIEPGLECINGFCAVPAVAGGAACYLASSKTCSQTEAAIDFCNSPNQRFDSVSLCEVYRQQKIAESTYPAGACRCGSQCIKYGDSAAGGSIVTPGNCGPCTEKSSFEKCTEEIARENYSASELSKYTDQLNKLQVDNLPALIGTLIKGLMGVVGTVALVMMLYGGITYMTARGNSESTTKARDTILWAGLGIVLIFASYALVNFVFEIFR
ncbi:MAG TPA: pilin [Candidatus Magasanikbacteria bacterium]|nr:pilin [Candidatus Magasanikbacteria bacterium]